MGDLIRFPTWQRPCELTISDAAFFSGLSEFEVRQAIERANLRWRPVPGFDHNMSECVVPVFKRDEVLCLFGHLAAPHGAPWAS